MRSIPFFLLALAAAAIGQPKPQYEVFAVRYATIPDFPVNQLVAGAEAGRKLDIAMMVWLIRGGGKNILFDAGFYREQFFRQWHVTDFVKPSDAVRRAGVTPEEITDVIVSHMHWDHADGMDLFPRRRSGCRRTNSNTTPGRRGNRGGRTAASSPTMCSQR